MSEVSSGAVAPDFTLTDIEGNPFTLSLLHGSKNVILVVNRGFM